MSLHHKPPFCETLRPGTCCAAPTPRETNNYYNRHHLRDTPGFERCRASCYCPVSCCCERRNMNGRYIEGLACDQDEDENKCCYCGGNKKKSSFNNNKAKCGSARGGIYGSDNVCCPGDNRRIQPSRGQQQRGCGYQSSTRSSSPPSRQQRCCRCGAQQQEDEDCQPCCPPYKPAKRRQICYPPIKCCETNECGQSPIERICYSPAPPPRPPKYCSCGSPNPCDCDLDARRRAALCEMSPCCRRCGRKVYAAEKIVAASGAFHSSCFSCYCCHKPLEVTNVYENQGEIYCKQCYMRYFGVSGYGYGNECTCKECVNN